MQYASPSTVAEAVRLLADAKGTAHVLAGGTDLVVQMTAGIRKPDLVVNIKNIADMNRVTKGKDGWHIGAAVSGAALYDNAELKADWPGVVEAIDLIGSMQVQSRCTPAGNLCNASPAADSVPAMIAAGATATIIGPDGTRTIPVEQVPASPGRTTLKKGEVITSINLPAKQPRSGDAYLRFIPRTEMDIAVVGVAVNLTLDASGTCTAARVSVGAVAPTALLVPDAAKALVGTKADDAALDKAAAAVRAACKPIDDKRGTAEYRIKVAGVMFKRAAAIALDRAKA